MKTEQALASARRRPNKVEAKEMQTKKAEGRRPKKRKKKKQQKRWIINRGGIAGLGHFVACGPLSSVRQPC